MPKRIYGAVYTFLAERFGGSVRSEKATETIGTTRSVVALRDPERVALTFVNLSAGTVWVLPGPDVTSTHGIRLDSQGGFLGMNVREDFVLPSEEWTAVGDAAALSLLVIRVRRETELSEDRPDLIPATPQPLAPEIGLPSIATRQPSGGEIKPGRRFGTPTYPVQRATTQTEGLPAPPLRTRS